MKELFDSVESIEIRTTDCSQRIAPGNKTQVLINGEPVKAATLVTLEIPADGIVKLKIHQNLVDGDRFVLNTDRTDIVRQVRVFSGPVELTMPEARQIALQVGSTD